MPTIEWYTNYIKKAHPEITRDHLIIPNTQGTANVVLFVESETPWVFRFPREDNLHASFQMKREQNILPLLKSYVPYIPQVIIISESPVQYIGYPKIPGQQLFPPLFSQIPSLEKEKLTKELAHFLRTLHTLPYKQFVPNTEEHEALFLWKKKYEDHFLDIKRHVFPILLDKQRNWTLELFGDFLSKHIISFNPCLINGDLKQDHILIDPKSYRLTGVIDMVLCLGDPALDFAYLRLGTDFRNLLLNNYSSKKDDSFLSRVCFYEKTVPFFGLLYGVAHNLKETIQTHLTVLDELIDYH